MVKWSSGQRGADIQLKGFFVRPILIGSGISALGEAMVSTKSGGDHYCHNGPDHSIQHRYCLLDTLI